MSLDSVKGVFADLKFSAQPEGATLDQVQGAEKQLGISLPPAYREFLQWMGVSPAGILLGSDWLIDDLPDLKPKAIKLMASNNFPKQLPADAFVFWMNQNNVLTFVLLSQGDASPVYRYHQTLDTKDFTIINKDYPEWLTQQIQEHVERQKSFGQKW